VDSALRVEWEGIKPRQSAKGDGDSFKPAFSIFVKKPEWLRELV